MIWAGGTLCCGSVSHALTTFDTLLERRDEAEAGFEAAIESSTRLGARSFVVLARRGFAWMLGRRGSQQDAVRARNLRRQAEREAARLGLAGEIPAA